MNYNIISFITAPNALSKNTNHLKTLITECQAEAILMPAYCLSGIYGAYERQFLENALSVEKSLNYLSSHLKSHQIMLLVEWNRYNKPCYFVVSSDGIVHSREIQVQGNISSYENLTYTHEDHVIALLTQEELHFYTSYLIQEVDSIALSDARRFTSTSLLERSREIKHKSQDFNLPILQNNLHGLQETVVYDGGILVATPEKELTGLDSFTTGIFTHNAKVSHSPLKLEEKEIDYRRLKEALVLGIREYSRATGISKAVIGLSGGIDSALVATLAKEALGADNVTGISLPSMYSSEHSLKDAKELAENLKIAYHVLPITPVYDAYIQQLASLFKGTKPDTTEENLQARIRGDLLMAESNKRGSLLLSTGNKSECAIGYATLYGDMCGGLSVISDLYKTEVYGLCRHLNVEATQQTGSDVIPNNTLVKAPSAELKPDQRDQDSLPPYEELDDILRFYLDRQHNLQSIIQKGFSETTVRWVITQLHKMEYKRRQAAPGLCISVSSFGFNRTLNLFV